MTASFAQKQEGLYGCDMKISKKTREINSQHIQNFINCVFDGKQTITWQEFDYFNTKVSSEMLLSVMSVLEERIACSEFYYREFDHFKNQLVNQEVQKKSD